jgi:hypothetical protein
MIDLLLFWNEDMDEEDPNILKVNTVAVELTKSTDHVPFGGSLCLLVKASLFTCKSETA